MVRRVALVASLLATAAMPVLAQAHSGSHDHSRNHGPGHVRPDSATHAAMHALWHGDWTGTLRSHQGVTTGLSMSLAHDSSQTVSLTMRTDQPMRLGAARDIALKGDRLTWTQDLAGAPCKATAVVTAAGPRTPDEITGRMTCQRDQITFSARKTAG